MLGTAKNSEAELINIVAKRLALAGFLVMKNVIVDNTEIDVIALEVVSKDYRPLVYVIEVKRRPKPKVYKQLEKRLRLADYIYIAIPYFYYLWALKKIDQRIGIMVLLENELYVVRYAKYIGNGFVLLSNLKIDREFVDIAKPLNLNK